jgi:acyl CoA:acetate/3-ketoacid CoA transferase
VNFTNIWTVLIIQYIIKTTILRLWIAFANFLGSIVSFHEIRKKEQILAFLNANVKILGRIRKEGGLPPGIITLIGLDFFSGGFIIARVKESTVKKLTSQNMSPLNLLK